MRIINKLSEIRNRTHQYINNHQYLFCVLIILIICIFEIRLITLIHINNNGGGAAAAEGILHGTPHWRTTQNRILGPAVVGLISNITGSPFFNCYRSVIWSLLIFANFLSFVLFLSLTKDKKQALKYSFLFAVLFLFIQNRDWLFIWDFIDLIVFLLFAYGIFNTIKLHYLVILFVVCLLNKENALYIGLWIFMDSFNFHNKIPTKLVDIIRRTNLNYCKLILGSLLIVGGMIYAKLIRDALFVQSMLPGVGYDLDHALWGQHFQATPNLYALVKITINFHFIEFVVPVILFIVPLYFIYKMKINELSIKVMFLFLFMVITIFVFGNITETRIFCILIPFALMLNLYFGDQIVSSNQK